MSIDNRINDKKAIKYHVKQYLLSIKDEITGKRFVDFPAGSGATTEVLLELGANVEPFDLFPEYFMLNSIKCMRANICDKIPLADNHTDWLICQEGMEHFSDQLKALKEFNRVIKTGGKLLITVPSYSNLGAKFSYLLFESENRKNMPQNELCDVWMSEQTVTSEIYYGHIFMIGVQKLRTLAKLAGFRICEIKYVSLSKGALFLFPFFYPLIVANSLFCYFRNIRKHNNISSTEKLRVFGEQLRLNIDPKTLLNKHTFIVFEKECGVEQVAAKLSSATSLYPFDKVM